MIMNQENFDLLIKGQPSKWAEFNELDSLSSFRITSKEDDNNAVPFRLNLLKAEEKDVIKNEIEQKQTPIPHHISDAIHKYVKTERGKGTTERVIRRAVKRKWNIFVI